MLLALCWSLAALAAPSEDDVAALAAQLAMLGLSHDVRVEATGAPPLAALRYAPQPDGVLTLQMRARQRIDPADETTAELLRPTQTVVVRERTIRRGRLDPFDHVRVRYRDRLVDVEGLSAGAAAALRQATDAGGFELELDPERGVLLDASIVADGGARAAFSAAQLRQSLLTMPRLPDQPLGAGARWSYSLPGEVAGVPVLVDHTVELIGADANTARLAIDLRYRLGDGAGALPGLGEGVASTVQAVEGAGRREWTIDLHTLAITGTETTRASLRGQVVPRGLKPLPVGVVVDEAIEVVTAGGGAAR